MNKILSDLHTVRIFIGILNCILLGTLVSCDIGPDIGFPILEPRVTAEYSADLSGENVRPNPTSTSATGKTTFTELLVPGFFSPSVCKIDYIIYVSDIAGITAVHIHAPAAGDEVTEVAAILSGCSELLFGNYFCSGSISPIADSLVVWMRTGQTYVDVHTKSNPDGEIRGQIIVENLREVRIRCP